jgi:uncharacterized cupredoxin-like copper-binding protein
MTQLETPPQLNVDRDSKPRSSSSDPSVSSPFWWIALSVTCVVFLLGAVAFVVGLSGSDSGQPKVFADAQVPVNLADFKVSMPASQVTAGAKTLQVTNGGAMQHELLVFQPTSGIDPSHLPLAADGNIDEEAAGVNLISDGENIDPGQSQTRQLDLSQPGTYVFLCNLAGHYKQGMWSIVTVK